MRIPKTILIAATALVGLATASLPAQPAERAQIPEQYKWNLADLFPSEEAWRQDREKFEAELPRMKTFAGQLGASAAGLETALETMATLSRQLDRLQAYALQLADEDTREAKGQAMSRDMARLATAFAAETAYLKPEILKLGGERIRQFLRERPGLKPYDHFLDNIIRRQPHTGTDAEERLIAQTGVLAGTPADIFGVFADADFPYPTVKLGDGTTVTLSAAAFALHRASPRREDRSQVMSEFFGALGNYRRTFGSTMNASVQKDLFLMTARRYGSTLEAALDVNNIPVEVYHRLIEGVNANLPTFHRYLRLRQRMLGVDTLHYYDLYAPLVRSVDLEYPVEQAQREILAALAPLGRDYVAVVERAFRERWIDLYPTSGKRSGAYSNGTYDVHPYMLLNYTDKYDDMSTLAHELGHTMHSFLSSQAQPYAKAEYPIFLAEVASTFNEALLIDHVLRQVRDRDARLSLLGNYLEGIKGTVFRQTQFAEFELRMHEMAERGEALTGDALAALYAGITRRYYGHDEGVTVVDDYVAHEWSYVPHFYRAYYVFQYATSYTASAALSERVLAGDPDATRRYLELISAGGSDYPIALLRRAGVDMTTREPLDLTMRRMNRVMDEMEKLLGGP